MEYIMFLFSCFVLVIASSLLVDSASSLATKLKVPKILIALTIVSFGTCAPELGISFNSIATQNYSIALANIIGSCIVNILMIIGIASIVHPIKLKHETIKKELPLLVFITTIFTVMVIDKMLIHTNGVLTRADGIILLLLFGMFVLYLIQLLKNKDNFEIDKPKFSITKSIVYLIISLFLIIISSDMLVDNAVIIAENLGISHKIITMVIVVIGTSLPELVMTVQASRKKEFDIAIGNIIGTNIFNICVVLGLPIAIFGNFQIVDFNVIDISVVLLSTIILYIFSKSDRKLSKIEGIIMFLIFIAYYIYIII